MLALENLSVYYQEKTLLNNVSLKIEQGDFYCLIGESGGGKTLIGKTLLGMLPEKFQVTGKVNRQSTKIELVLQNPLDSMPNNIKIKKQFHHLLAANKIAKNTWSAEIEQVLKQVGFDAPTLIVNKRPYELSGGMCQRVALAFALISQPELIIADEVTSALDENSQNTILELLKKLQTTTNCTIFFITHDLDLVKKYSTKMSVVKDGCLIESGLTNNVLHRPQKKYTKELIDIFED